MIDRSFLKKRTKDEIYSMTLETLINVFDEASVQALNIGNFVDAVSCAYRVSELINIGMFLVTAHIDAQDEKEDGTEEGS